MLVKHVLVLEHEADSGIGLFAEIFSREDLIVTTLRPGTDALPSSAGGFDALVVLGASPSVNDPGIRGWFDAELALMKAADQGEVPIFGICFGAQALAVALGGSVERSAIPEYGWKMIDSNAPSVISEGPWFQWHVDTIIAPQQAEILATSDSGVQAYRVGRHLAVQFHPEADVQQASEWPMSDVGGQIASGMSTDEHIAITRAMSPDSALRAAALWDAFVDGADS